MMSYDFKTTLSKPKWYKLRNQLSNFFLYLAKKCYSENPEVWAFMCKKIIDQQIYGSSVMEVTATYGINKKEIKNG